MRLYTLVAPERSQVEAISSDTGFRKMRPGHVGRETDLAQRGDGQVLRASIGQPVIESMIEAPMRVGRVESQDLCTLPPLRSGSILPISIARVEPAFVGGENADLGASHGSGPRCRATLSERSYGKRPANGRRCRRVTLRRSRR